MQFQLLADAVEQQLWCFGRDINHPEGNLLMHFGFQRERPPQGFYGSTRYAYAMQDGMLIRLWGFGMTIDLGEVSTERSLIIRRHPLRFGMLSRAAANCCRVWDVREFPSSAAHSVNRIALPTLPHLRALAQMLATYERGVVHSHGDEYRLRCDEARPRNLRRKMTVRAEQLAEFWESFVLEGAPLDAATVC